MAMTSGNGSFGSIESFNSGNTAKLPVALNAYGGNVGIGMTNPGYLLDVNGTLNIRGSFIVNGTAVATGTGSVWTVGASNAIYYSAGNTCLYRNRLIFSNAINDFNHSIFNNLYNLDSEGVWDGMKFNVYAGAWFRVGNASGATPTTAMYINNSGYVGIGTTTPSYLTTLSSGGFINLEINRTGAGTNYGSGIIHSLTSSTGSFRGEYAFAFGGATTIATSAQSQAYGYYGIDLANAGTFATNSVGYTGSYFFVNTSSACFPKTNVGIGKTNPNASYSLDVAGAINCTSFLVNGTAVATGTGSVWGVNGSIAYYTSGNVGISTTAAITNLHVRVPTYSSPVFIVDAGGQGTDSSTVPRGIGRPLIGVGAYSWSNASSGDYYGIGFGYIANLPATQYYAAEIGFLIQNTAGGEYGDLVFSTRPTSTGTTIASERMRITSAGNVGIGTTSPAQFVHLYNDGARLRIESGTANNPVLELKTNGSTSYIFTDQSGNLQLYPYTPASQSVFINPTGKVGIANSGSSLNTYLCVGSNGGVNQSTNIPGISMTSVSGQNMHYSVGQGTAGTNNVFLKWGYNATASSGYGSVSCYGGNNPLVLQEGGGNVGINTTSPVYPLTLKTVSSTNGFTHTDGTIIVGSFIGGSVTAGWYGTTSNHPLCFFTNNSAASMTINTSSQVGIGTITPSNKLHVYSTTANDGIVFQNAYNSSTGSIALYTSTAAGNFILDGTANAGMVLPAAGMDLFLNRTTGLYTSMVVKGGTGYVGIGTATPGSKFVVYNSSTSQFSVLSNEVDIVGSDVSGGSICTSITSNNTGTSTYGTSTYGRLGRLTVNYNTSQGGTGQASYWRDWGIDNNGSLFFTQNQSAAQALTITSGGSIGIGTASPSAVLYINNATADYTNSLVVNTSWPSIRLGNASVTGRDWVILNGGSGAGIGQGNLGIWDATASTYRFAIDSNGNVGIGNFTSIPTKLYVNAITDVSTGICQINAMASDANAKSRLNGINYGSLMPAAYSTNIYLYTSSGTTVYRTIIAASTYFTGQHANQPLDTDLKTNIQNYVGLIVSSADQGYYSINPITNEIITGSDAITITEALPYIELTSSDKDPAVWGVLTNVKNDNINTDGTTSFDNDHEWGDRLGTMVRVNGLGEGAVWVTNINGPIRNGDLICSSIIPGYGRKQDDDLFHNYTVAKTTMSCNFDLSTTKYKCKTINLNGVDYIAAFIGCTYHCS